MARIAASYHFFLNKKSRRQSTASRAGSGTAMARCCVLAGRPGPHLPRWTVLPMPNSSSSDTSNKRATEGKAHRYAPPSLLVSLEGLLRPPFASASWVTLCALRSMGIRAPSVMKNFYQPRRVAQAPVQNGQAHELQNARVQEGRGARGRFKVRVDLAKAALLRLEAVPRLETDLARLREIEWSQ
jgi:hypothetical protein